MIINSCLTSLVILSAAAGAAQQSSEHTTENLPAHLAPHRPRRLLCHRLHHALAPLRPPDEIVQRAAGWCLFRRRSLRRRRSLCGRRSLRRRHYSLVENLVCGFAIHGGVVLAANRAARANARALLDGN